MNLEYVYIEINHRLNKKATHFPEKKTNAFRQHTLFITQFENDMPAQNRGYISQGYLSNKNNSLTSETILRKNP